MGICQGHEWVTSDVEFDPEAHEDDRVTCPIAGRRVMILGEDLNDPVFPSTPLNVPLIIDGGATLTAAGE